MSRSKRKRKKIQQHIRNYKSTYLSVSLIVSSAAVIMVLANMLIKEESRYRDTVKQLAGTPTDRYQRALGLVIEGDLDQARILMFNLARLGDDANNPLGYGKAHLWVAEDKLRHFNADFIWKFPGIDGRGDNFLALPQDEETEKIQLHLAHAVAKNPELQKASSLWAATLASQGERNQAIEVLMDAIGNPRYPHPQLHIPLAHILAMDGNDLELRDRALYLFTELGRTTRYSRDKNIEGRITYILSAIILQRYDIADNALQILETRFPREGNSNKDPEDKAYARAAEQVRALRMAFHYHQAIAAFKDAQSKNASSYEKVVDALEKVILVYPECDSAIAALSHIAQRDANQSTRIAQMLKDVSTQAATQPDSEAQARVNISLAKLASGQTQDRRKLLEGAVASDPANTEAVIELTRFLLAEDQPDYPRIEQIVRRALRDCDRIYRADLYHYLGAVQVYYKDWGAAIVSLEKSLAKATAKEEVHRLLATAYAGIGQPDIAKEHQKLADKKS
ncbi:MAG: hypothetical protein ACPHVK_08695 [Akkermansiaceae bacterium]